MTVHVPVPEHPPPDQPLKLEPEAGVAVTVTVVPDTKLFEQVPGQLIPEPATLPEPLPVNATARLWDVWDGGLGDGGFGDGGDDSAKQVLQTVSLVL